MSTHEAIRPDRAVMTRPGLGSAIASEFSKLTSVPSHRALLAVAIGLAPLVALIFFLSLPVTQGTTLSELPAGELLSVAILGIDALAFMTVILAALHVGSEYSTGMIGSTLTITPARGRVLTGKFVVVGVTSLLLGIIAASLCVGLTLVVAAALGDGPGLVLTGPGLQLALGSIAMPVLYALLAAAGAFVFRSTALGIVIPLVVMAVGGLAGWFGDVVSAVVTPLTPTAAIHSLSGVASGHEAIGVAGAVISLFVWAGLSVGAAAWRLRRHDAE